MHTIQRPSPTYTVESASPADVLQQRVAQAHAVSRLLVGEGFDLFKDWREDDQHAVLWALSALLDDAAVALSRGAPGGAA